MGTARSTHHPTKGRLSNIPTGGALKRIGVQLRQLVPPPVQSRGVAKEVHCGHGSVTSGMCRVYWPGRSEGEGIFERNGVVVYHDG